VGLQHSLLCGLARARKGKTSRRRGRWKERKIDRKKEQMETVVSFTLTIFHFKIFVHEDEAKYVTVNKTERKTS
jgi:hypothetical protein